LQPLTEAELAQLQGLMDGIPDTLEPLDVVMIDGFLCGVLLQPQPVPPERWLPLIPDVDGRPPPARFDVATMRALVLRRHAELDAAIARRQWFDPWIYQLDDEATLTETVLPWVAGFAVAVEAHRADAPPRAPAAEPWPRCHFDPEDLEDADELLQRSRRSSRRNTCRAVEDPVRSVLIADVSRPVSRPQARPAPRGPARRAGVSRTPGGRGRPGPGPR
jgi:uncharacterized protein